ncbi:chromosome segregation in meiosis- protein [Ophidiomyces ophidiicola]|nr:chromosome segregation in meiosis- protein [Ophidiomyces ophidiicola]KAI1940660.1 chromosome segregation in meiosis- protein [Ophidiomyces ophidiicola]
MAGNSAIDDLFDYDAGIEHLLRDPEEDRNTQDASKQSRAVTDGKNDNLGIDEEIKVTKRRVPPAKLDETRLLSQAGIPKLRKSAKTKLKFHGKRHEFSDVARLLNFYQLWLDDLYPRSKFADGLDIIEKLGHSKRMQVMRKEWIEEGKPGRSPLHTSNTTSKDQASVDISVDNQPNPTKAPTPPLFVRGPDTNQTNNLFESRENSPVPEDSTLAFSIFGNSTQIQQDQESDDRLSVPVEGNLSSIQNPLLEATPNKPQINQLKSIGPIEQIVDEEDDLDALLAEAEGISGIVPGDKGIGPVVEDFDDELDIMNEFGL